MKEIKISSLSELIDRSNIYSRNMLYRGVEEANYNLIPSLGRLKTKEKHPDSLERYEITTFERFKTKAIPYLEKIPKNDLEWLFLAQHHGIETRLLDCTENPLVATYFATNSNIEKDCAIYEWMSTKELSPYIEDDFPFISMNNRLDHKPALIRPNHQHNRYINQASAFTYHPKPTEKFEPNGIKYIIEAKNKSEIKEQLRKLGFNHSFIYQDLDSLCKDVKEECNSVLTGGIDFSNYTMERAGLK